MNNNRRAPGDERPAEPIKRGRWGATSLRITIVIRTTLIITIMIITIILLRGGYC